MTSHQDLRTLIASMVASSGNHIGWGSPIGLSDKDLPKISRHQRGCATSVLNYAVPTPPACEPRLSMRIDGVLFERRIERRQFHGSLFAVELRPVVDSV